MQPIQIHAWVRQVLDGAEMAFERSPGANRDEREKDQRIARLEAKLVDNNEVIEELMHEHVVPGKELGEP